MSTSPVPAPLPAASPAATLYHFPAGRRSGGTPVAEPVAMLSPDDPRWDRFLASAAHDVFSLPGYVALCGRHEGGRPVGVLAGTAPHQVLVPLLLRDIPGPHPTGAPSGLPWLDAASPYGFPAVVPSDALRDDPDAAAITGRLMRDVVAALRGEGVVSLFLRLHPLLPIDESALTALGEVVHHGRTVSIDLTTPATSDDVRQILPGMSRNHRRGLERLARGGFSGEIVSTNAPGAARDFVRIYTNTMDRLRAAPLYYVDEQWVHDLAEAIDGQAIIMRIRDGHTVVAAGLLTTVGGIVEDLYGGALPSYAHVAPTKLKFPLVVRWARERGYRVFHLGGGLGGREDDLFQFKAGFGTGRHDFATARIVVDRERYDALVRQAGDTPADPEFFPAYRAP